MMVVTGGLEAPVGGDCWVAVDGTNHEYSWDVALGSRLCEGR